MRGPEVRARMAAWGIYVKKNMAPVTARVSDNVGASLDSIGLYSDGWDRK